MLKAFMLPSRPESLAPLRWLLSNLTYDYGFSEDNQDNVIIAVDEACANIFEHAYSEIKHPPPLEIFVAMNEDSFTVDLIDGGTPFDFRSYTMPEFPKHYIEGNERGAGVYMIHQCMDQVEYDRLPDDRNRTRMVKWRHSADETRTFVPSS
jgi:serine/threonine-protein kinase RsbW